MRGGPGDLPGALGVTAAVRDGEGRESGGAGTENDVPGPVCGAREREGDEWKKIDEKNIKSALKARLQSIGDDVQRDEGHIPDTNAFPNAINGDGDLPKPSHGTSVAQPSLPTFASQAVLRFGCSDRREEQYRQRVIRSTIGDRNRNGNDVSSEILDIRTFHPSDYDGFRPTVEHWLLGNGPLIGQVIVAYAYRFAGMITTFHRWG